MFTEWVLRIVFKVKVSLGVSLRASLSSVEPLIPLFWTSGDICPGFQSIVCFFTYVILRFTSGVTPADCIEVSMAAKLFWSTYLQMCLQALVEVWALAWTHDHQCHMQQAQCCKPLSHSGTALWGVSLTKSRSNLVTTLTGQSKHLT